jgi:hypothetical protein
MTGDTLRAWSIDPLEFPGTGILVDKARFAVGYATPSLSGHNTQLPVIADELLADRSCGRPLLDRFDRALGLSYRAALVNVVGARFGLPVETATLPQASGSERLARIGLRVTMELNGLFASISGRATDRIRQTLERLRPRAAQSRYQAALNQAAAIRMARFAALMVRRRRGPSEPHPPRRRLADALS